MRPPRDANNKQKRSSSSAQNSDNPGALFPRLHVRETRNAGPRGPPRNKMALYEQLTVPSLRFQQNQNAASSSTSSARPSYLLQQPPPRAPPPQAYPGTYYVPCYIGPALPYQPMHMVQQTFPGQSSVEMDIEHGELQRVPGDSTAQFPQPPPLSQSNASKRTSIRRVQEDFAVPTYSCGAPAAVGVPREPQQSNDASPSNSCEDNNGDLENQTDEEQTQQQSSEVSEASDASVLDNATPGGVTAKDIIDAVGEPHFWKMRKAMQRQQHLFQNQVFELHRVTKVQQLMAEASLNEETSTKAPEKQAPTTTRTPPETAPSTTVSNSSVTLSPSVPIPPPAPTYGTHPQVPQAMTAPYMGYGHGGQGYGSQGGQGYGGPGYGGQGYGGQGYGGPWFPPVYPYHQPFYSSPPYGGVPFFSAPGGVPFVHYPNYEQQYQHPGYEQQYQLPGYEQQRPEFTRSYEVTGASYVAPTQQHKNKNKTSASSNSSRVTRAEVGSSGGFDLIQRVETGSNAPMDIQQDREDEETPTGNEQESEQQQQQQQQRRVAPKASMVTPESAAGILQSIRRSGR